jgi:iron(III) transport system ATP-binding protein
VIQQVGTPRELYDAPVNRFVAEFVGSINLYAGTVRAGGTGTFTVEVAGLGRVALPDDRVAGNATGIGGGVAVAFRPHAVRLASPGPVEGLAFEAEVGTTEFLGEFVRHELVVGALRVVADLPHARFAEAQRPGARVRFVVAPGEILVLAG